ncbi:MAG: NAD-dependent DNA ligase LigA [Rhodothermia bacterium]|nr:MAG: NAD-dependent DNA ligase LigA [Rhodothermia bacterium]
MTDQASTTQALSDKAITVSPEDVSREEAEQLLRDLTQVVAYHADRYYAHDDPLISDAEYDRLFHFLKDLEANHPDLQRGDSPTMRVGAEPLSAFSKVEHPERLLSLSNAFDSDALLAWYERCRKGLGLGETDKLPVTVELKIDGLAVALTYENGILVRGATRGNGRVGEDVTANLRTVSSIPLSISAGSKKTIAIPSRLEVRGEVYFRRSDFDRLNAGLTAAGERTYANPRNTAAGSLRQLDSRITAKRDLSFFAYSVGPVDGEAPTSQSEILSWLASFGFDINEHSTRFEDITEVVSFCNSWTDRRDTLDYEIDGVVVKVDSKSNQDALGTIANAPRWAVAFKFPAREETTVLADIIINVGRTGMITPEAVLEPVEIGGVTVTQASLHNADYIRDRDIRIGDRVIVKRAGDVIPQVLGPIEGARTGDEETWTMPEVCPVCETKLERLEGEVDSYCVASDCPAQFIRLLEHFASREAMDIEGMGSKLAVQLAETGLVQTLDDVYRLDAESLSTLEGFGEKKVSNLLDGINGSKNRTLSRLLFAIGIRYVGQTTAEILASTLSSARDLFDTAPEALLETEGIGQIIAQSISEWFSLEHNRALIDDFDNLGVNITRLESEAPPPDVSSAFDGYSFVVTGTLESMGRKEAQEAIKQKGGSVSSSVSGKTSFVVVGENPGSKAARAEELGVQILDEEDFLKLLNG